MIRTILVDYDNTLHDSDSKFIAKFKPLAKKLGLDGRKLWNTWLYKVHREIIHKDFPERHDDERFHSELLLRYLNLPCEKIIIEQLTLAYRKALKECVKNPSFFPDTFEFLDRIVGRYELCLTTYGNAIEKAACIERFGKRKYFDYILGDHNIAFHKNTVEFYKEALKISNSKPEETVAIGDALTHDVIPAKQLGIKTVWVNRKAEVALEGSKPDFEAKDLLEVLDYLGGFY